MTHAAKKMMKNKEQGNRAEPTAGHTLWTSSAHVRDAHRYESDVTDALEHAFRESLARSQEDLNKKLQAFESVPLSDTATRCVVM
jgi:hypothetical protein